MKVLLGVTGCIGAYKSVLILRLLQAEGLEAVPVMTQNARHFLGPLTLNKLSGFTLPEDPFQTGSGEIEHITLARQSDLLLVAPATANILAKFANGIADDFLSTLYLATTTPVIIAPAMNVEMWRHPATRENIEVLRRRGVVVVDPESGYQACGETGEGRLAAPETIVRHVLEVLGFGHSLEGIHVLVTAGPTVEDIDPVRFISNRSSGKMGYALAAEARRRGARVDLVSGPTREEPPPGVKLHPIRSAAEMAEMVLSLVPDTDVIVKAAAVADFTPANPLSGKLKKKAETLHLELAPTRDILEEIGKAKRPGQVLVGFAAESENLEENARSKLRRKNLDLIIANRISGGSPVFGSDENEVDIIDRELNVQRLPRMKKSALAGEIWDRILPLLPGREERS